VTSRRTEQTSAEIGMEKSAVQKEVEFLRFLLVANHSQGTCLLKIITASQTNAISEVFFNILFSQDVGDLSKELKNHKVLIREIGDKDSGVRRRRNHIVAHTRAVWKILQLVESIIPLG